MARIKHGWPGSLSGKIGNVIASNWKGIPYFRSLPVKSNKPPSPAQLRQRQRFSEVVRFLKPLRPVVETYFRDRLKYVSGFNAAISYNYHHALVETSEGYCIDYSQAAISRGTLPNVLQPMVETEPGGILWFHWQNNAGTGIAAGQDLVILVVYCPELGQCIHKTGSALRCDETATVIARAFAGKEVVCWIACTSRDNRNVSLSAWLGNIVVLE